MTDQWHEFVKTRISKDLVFRDLGGEMVLPDLDPGRYLGFDEVGSRFWSLLIDEVSLDEAGCRLLTDYAVDRARLQRDLLGLIEELEKSGLVELDGE
jgi:hypothetical protein